MRKGDGTEKIAGGPGENLSHQKRHILPALYLVSTIRVLLTAEM